MYCTGTFGQRNIYRRRTSIDVDAVEKLVAGGAEIVCFQYPAGAKFALDAKEPVVDIGCSVIGIVGVSVGPNSKDAIVRIEALP